MWGPAARQTTANGLGLKRVLNFKKRKEWHFAENTAASMQFNESESPVRHSDSSAVPPRTKVFGIGWAKTGTTTLGRCFEILGYNHQSQNLSLVPQILRGDFDKTLRIAAAKESFEDWPWPLVYREMDAAFPGSRFVVTTRDPDRWLASYRAMLAAENPPAPEVRDIRCQLFRADPSIALDEQLVSRFLAHNAEVLKYFKDRPADLLVVDWESGDSWENLCHFLRTPVPNDPFPHLNRRV